MCVYGGSAGRQRALGDAAEGAVHLDSLPDLSTSTCDDTSMFGPGFVAPPPETAVDLIASPSSFRLSSTLDHLLDTLPEAGFEDWSWQTGLLRQQSEAPSATVTLDEKTMILKDYSNMTDMCVCDHVSAVPFADPSMLMATGVLSTMAHCRPFHHDLLYLEGLPRPACCIRRV